MMKRFLLIPLMVVLVSGLILGGCAAPAPAPAPVAPAPGPEPTPVPGPAAPAPAPEIGTGPIKIGQVWPLTGWAAVYCGESLDFTALYVDYINAQGGIYGRPIELIVYDDETDTEVAALYVTKLIEKDKVLAILGPLMTAQAYAGIEAARFRGVPMIGIAPMIQTPEASMPGSNIFFMDAPAGDYLHAGIDYLKERRGVNTLAILATTGESGQEDLDWFTEGAEKYGVEIIIAERISPAAIDAIPQLTKIKAANADALALGGSADIIGPIMKGIKLLGFDIPVLGSTGLTSKEMFDLIKGYEPEDVILLGTTPQVAGYNVLPPDHYLMQLGDFMWSIWEAEYGETRGTREELLLGWAYDGFVSMHLYWEALKQAGPLPADLTAAREAINYALENKIVGFEQLVGRRTITPTDHCGLKREAAEVIFVTIREGQIVPLD